MPRKKVIEKKSPDPVKVEGELIGEVIDVIKFKKYKGIEILRFIGENTTAYHIQLANGTSTWVPKDEVK